MDLRQLEHFLRVAQRKNISLAAADLNIAQPTLTKSIKLLEEQLGVKLFERLPRGVALTSFGTTLLRHAEAVHVQMKDAGHEIAAQRTGAVGTVVIGAGPTWLRRYLPTALADDLGESVDPGPASRPASTSRCSVRRDKVNSTS
jgi:DNA-binding transcriptional LysR family regulator